MSAGSGVRVLNGADAWRTEISKARQPTLLQKLGLPYPRSRVLSDATQAPKAGDGLRRFESREELEAAVPELDFATGRHIVRVEVLGARYLYAIAEHPPEGSFNLCPADACVTGDGEVLQRTFCAADAAGNGLRVGSFTPPAAIQTQVEDIMAAAGIDVGGVEYVVDEWDGRLRFYDINALSNFVADAGNVIGFDPFERMVDWLEDEMDAVKSAAVG